MAKISDKWKDMPDGKRVKVYIIRYQDKSKLNAAGKPVHRQETFERKKLAEARLLQIQTELATGGHVARGATVTVAEACDMFMRHAEDRLRDGRIGRSRYLALKSAMDCGIVPHIGSIQLANLTSVLIEGCYNENIRKSGVHPLTAKHRIMMFRLVTDFATKRGMMKGNPVQEALKDLRGIKAGEVRIFTKEEVLKILAISEMRLHKETRRCHLQSKLFINIAAFCGLRWGEITGLTVPCLDLIGRVINVRHNYTAWNELKSPKTKAGLRQVPMPEHIAKLLQEWLKTFYVCNEKELVFVREKTGLCLSAASFHSGSWHKLLKRAGLFGADNFHFHALRHFAASWWIDNGMPVTDVAKLMGHSKVNMTMQVYAHSMSTGRVHQDMMDRMSSALLARPAQP